MNCPLALGEITEDRVKDLLSPNLYLDKIAGKSFFPAQIRFPSLVGCAVAWRALDCHPVPAPRNFYFNANSREFFRRIILPSVI